MTQLFAQPYDISATGFYFQTLEEYQEKSAKNMTHPDTIISRNESNGGTEPISTFYRDPSREFMDTTSAARICTRCEERHALGERAALNPMPSGRSTNRWRTVLGFI